MFDPNELSNFHGSETFYRHGLVRSILFTEGARYVAEMAGAYWLLDEIALAQYKPVVRREEFQVWKLEKVQGNGYNRAFVLSMEDGNDHVIFTKIIPFSDFPVPSVTLWFENNTIFLPSER